ARDSKKTSTSRPASILPCCCTRVRQAPQVPSPTVTTGRMTSANRITRLGRPDIALLFFLGCIDLLENAIGNHPAVFIGAGQDPVAAPCQQRPPTAVQRNLHV